MCRSGLFDMCMYVPDALHFLIVIAATTHKASVTRTRPWLWALWRYFFGSRGKKLNFPKFWYHP